MISILGKLGLNKEEMNPSPSAWARVKSLFFRAGEASRPSEVLSAEPGSAADAARRMLAAAESGLLSNLELDEDAATTADTHSSRWLLTQGMLVASRFEIVQPIGRGGMGEIYEAIDHVKDLSVALKVVLPNPTIDPQTADRLLRREVSLAQMVSHRNICRIFDPYLHQPQQGPSMLVVSMEMLRGRTLSAVLADRGRLDAGEAADIARQLAAGIDAAHAAGVVHRDLKPSNVILVAEDGVQRVVITDFGLARRATAQTVTKLSKAVAGTLRYMAPEQIQGRADRRSDLYTFAFILFELLTGELPFTGDSDLSLALNRLCCQPRDPGTLAPGISLAWRAALLRGLSREPERRFRTARELTDAIDAPKPFVILWSRILAFRWQAIPSLARLALLVALVSTWSIIALLLRPTPSLFPAFSRILIAELQHVETKDGALLGADATLAAAVGQSPHLSVVRPSELTSTLAKMGRSQGSPIDEATVRQLAMRTGYGVVLFGSISKGRSYVLHLRIEGMGRDPRRAAVADERKFEAPDDKALFGAIASAASWVRKLSGEGARDLDEQNARPEDLTTSSWEALRLLEEARARRAANDPQGALVFAKEALDLDPEFAAAESFSADTHTDLRQFKEGFEGYRRALDLVKKRNVTGRERYQIEAAYNADAGDDQASLTTYAAWIAHFPQDYLPHFYLGYLQFHQGDYQGSLAELQRAQQLGPLEFFILPHQAAAYLANEQFERAQECANRLRTLGENDWAIEVEGLMLLARHRFVDAAQKIAPLATRKDGVFSSVGPRYVASALADAGRLHDAEQALLRADVERGRNSLARFADRELEIAYLRWAQGDFNGVRVVLAPVVKDLDNPDSLSLAGALFARIGDLNSASRVLALMGGWPLVPVVVKASARVRAEIGLATNERRVLDGIAGSQKLPHSLLDLESLLYAARSKKTGKVESIRREILARRDVVLGWDERHAPPGLYWLSVCEANCRAR